MYYSLNFLDNLFTQTNRTIYAKIISLNLDGRPQEEISGRVSQGGSINVDGKSAVRRSCNLTLTTENQNITPFFWAMHSKFKVEIGLLNTVDKSQPEIIWFKAGEFLISSFSLNRGTDNLSISIQGKDKMSALNGEIAGHFPFSVELGLEKIEDKAGNVVEQPKLIKDIIFQAIHVFGREPIHNIIINDLDEDGLELLKYVGEEAMYFIRNSSGEVTQLVTGKKKVFIDDSADPQNIENIKTFYSLSPFIEQQNPTIIYLDASKSEQYTAIKIINGLSVGYRKTDLVYPKGSLIASPGETITSILDKIVKVFSDYEYFYDVEGRFVFQKKRTYVNSAWSPVEKETLRVDFNTMSSNVAYRFNNGKLLKSFNSTPNILNLKNDYVVWGERTNSVGNKVDIHLRYAIDVKPTSYIRTDSGEEYRAETLDWRELIYQMADDYYSNANKKGNEFYIALQKLNPWCLNGVTGYEQYYSDIHGFWRELYTPTEGWKTSALESPEDLVFWFDFIEAKGEVAKYGTKIIGQRSKVVKDSQATAISFREIPNVLFVKNFQDETNRELGYTYIQLPSSQENLFDIQGTQKSLKDAIDVLLYNHLYATETVSISALPIYYLEPNTIITVEDNDNNIHGEYIVNTFTIPLNYDGLMSINGIQSTKRIY